MKRRLLNSSQYQIILQLFSDIMAITLSFILQYVMRFSLGLFKESYYFSYSEFGIGIGIFIIYWLIVFFLSGMYKNWYERSPFDEVWNVIKSVFFGTFIFVFILFYSSGISPRMMFVIYMALLTSLVFFGRYMLRLMQKKLRRKSIIKIPVLLVGTFEKTQLFEEKTRKSVNWGYVSKGIILTSEREYDKINSEKKIDKFEDFDKIIDETNPDIIIISTERPNHEKLIKIVEIARLRNIRVKIEPDLYDIFTGQTKTQFLYGIPLIEISTQLLKPWQSTVKRLFDIIFSALVIIVGFPLWLLTSIAIKIDSAGPIFFVQERVGRNGKPFKIFKYRSMRINEGGNWTKVNDDRVTKFGKFIRKTHLDEIPQFINVLIGDMSVVGPRPEQVKFVNQFTEEVPNYARRHLVRPGITGWWQVKYTTYEFSIDEIKNRLKDDFYYIENISLKLDFEIIIRTVWLVLSRHGQA